MITPFIRCVSGAQSQAKHYCSIFPDARITATNAIVTTFQIYGQSIATLNGGEHPDGKLNPSISFSLWIKDEAETKRIRELLSDGGSVMMPFDKYVRSPAYGRCNDKYGVSRQVMYDNRDTTSTSQLIPSMMFVGDNNGQAQSAMDLYTSIFPDSKVYFTRTYGDNKMGEDPTHLSHAEFVLDGQVMIAMDSGMDHKFNFNDGVSLMVSCDGQDEVDHYWDKLIADGGHAGRCGRCKDRFGVSRQVIPTQIIPILSDPTTPPAIMDTFMSMSKIIIADLYQ